MANLLPLNDTRRTWGFKNLRSIILASQDGDKSWDFQWFSCLPLIFKTIEKQITCLAFSAIFGDFSMVFSWLLVIWSIRWRRSRARPSSSLAALNGNPVHLECEVPVKNQHFWVLFPWFLGGECDIIPISYPLWFRKRFLSSGYHPHEPWERCGATETFPST